MRRTPDTAEASASVIHPADALVEAVLRFGAPVCVGLDPVADRLPTQLLARERTPDTDLEAIQAWTADVLATLAPIVPCVKLQSACWERFGAAGVHARDESVRLARRLGLLVVLDGKRGDIGISAEHYAHALGAAVSPDPAERPNWNTVNAYLGRDGLEPFLAHGGGAFALVRTSNPGGDSLQSTRLADGGTVADRVAAVVAEVGRSHVGTSGYSALGAVVGATKPQDLERLRAAMPEQIFLVPGFGAQGGTVESVRACFHDGGRGAIITASRSVIYAADPGSADWLTALGDAARRFAEDIGRATGLRSSE